MATAQACICRLLGCARAAAHALQFKFVCLTFKWFKLPKFPADQEAALMSAVAQLRCSSCTNPLQKRGCSLFSNIYISQSWRASMKNLFTSRWQNLTGHKCKLREWNSESDTTKWIFKSENWYAGKLNLTSVFFPLAWYNNCKIPNTPVGIRDKSFPR